MIEKEEGSDKGPASFNLRNHYRENWKLGQLLASSEGMKGWRIAFIWKCNEIGIIGNRSWCYPCAWIELLHWGNIWSGTPKK
jgi:hypothetical protein